MFNDLDRLRQSADLLTLLAHYAELAGPDRQAWHDRRMALEGCPPRELCRLHGQLIACGWLEQNTGELPAVVRKGEVPGCYRAAPAGLRAVKQARAGADE